MYPNRANGSIVLPIEFIPGDELPNPIARARVEIRREFVSSNGLNTSVINETVLTVREYVKAVLFNQDEPHMEKRVQAFLGKESWPLGTKKNI